MAEDVIHTTPEHLFYVKDVGFVEARLLRKNDRLACSSGDFGVILDVEIELCEEAVEVYNFEVEEYHTYHVGDVGVWVHNADYDDGVSVGKDSGDMGEIEPLNSNSSPVKIAVKKLDIAKLKKELNKYKLPHTKQSGNFGEIIASNHKINNLDVKKAGYDLEVVGKTPPTGLNDKIEHGIDAIYQNKNKNSPYEFIIDEGKYNTAQQGMTKDGLQMSDDWLLGRQTGKSRIDKFVGNDKVLANKIKDALENGKVARVLSTVDKTGSIKSYILDSNGKK